MTWVVLSIILIALYWFISLYVLSGKDLTHFDGSIEDTADDLFDAHPDDAQANKKIIKQLNETHRKAIASKSIFKALKIARFFADNLSCDLITDTEFKPVTANGIDCEWSIAPNANPKKRLLFFHGGAFIFGSAQGHRKFSDQLSKVSSSAVLSVNYRMLPKFNRTAGVKDAQKAYQWIIDNGPEGKQKSELLIVAGDSAGGSLALMLSSWNKNNSARKPDGVIGFSPSTDQTLSSKWLKLNRKTDPMLGDGLGRLINLPRSFCLWLLLITTRSNPSSHLVSPVYSDLSDLPPTLIHASSSEMLIGDSIRYVNRARAAGSEIKFQVWHDQIHDWHLFNMGYGSANVAWNEVAKFISQLQR